MPRLKVYRTTIGFHDAFVAAPSQKAALEAWGTDKNLFARGAADVVTDPALMEAPLARPGEVIKVSRGDLREQLAALEPMPKRKASTVSKAKPDKSPPPPPPPKKKPKPRPSRAAVDAAAAGLEEAHKRQDREMHEMREREAKLAREKAALQARHGKEVARLEAALARKRGAYAAALRKWQD